MLGCPCLALCDSKTVLDDVSGSQLPVTRLAAKPETSNENNLVVPPPVA